ncbi:sigma-70 family RNA polymerase sigma factor [Pedobacter sp. BS3]|uniref:RNA polymerase sigma factor n=1 Tax=Pedobacter sp. BS3 TaxID=2567937 RepID=UPI0011ED8DA8|nr:sigma-70 family RNA polymerase sigma factor [Pedobacter sp. BS3]TZF81523.1 sigma-70 family RNA polymerase sigma factor [Pedobacter sp. BS3]
MLAGKKHSEEDSKLLSELSDGSALAFQTLYNRYWSDVIDEAFKRLDDIDHAKDVVQDVFACLWSKAGSAEIKNLPAWLTTVTKNQVFSHLKKRQRFVPLTEIYNELEQYGGNTDAVVLRKELVAAYEALINALPEQQRIIFNMRYKEGFTPDQIAEKLNISPKTVRNHLGRALAKLKTAIFIVNIFLLLTQK